MRYYGLHFVGDDRTPVQVCVDTRKQRVFARSCPNGEWTAWRRLDVTRNQDGTLAEQVSDATHAKSADTAVRLQNSPLLKFSGDVTGQAIFDGSSNVEITLSISSLSGILSRLSALEKRSKENY